MVTEVSETEVTGMALPSGSERWVSAVRSSRSVRTPLPSMGLRESEGCLATWRTASVPEPVGAGRAPWEEQEKARVVVVRDSAHWTERPVEARKGPGSTERVRTEGS